MNINLTLIVQMFVFATLIWGTMKWIWPPILAAMDERQRKIAQGLAAGEKGEQALTEARSNADAIIREARERATQIIDHAQHRANEMVDEAKGTATTEGARLVAAAQQQIDLDTTRARESLRKEVAGHRRGRRLEAARARDRRRHARRSCSTSSRRRSRGSAKPWPTSSPSPGPMPAPPSRRRTRTTRWPPGPKSLQAAAEVVNDARVANLLGNPRVTPEQLAQLFIDVGGDRAWASTAPTSCARWPRTAAWPTCRRSPRCSRR